MTLCVDQWQSTCGVNQYRSQTQSTLFTPKKLAQALVAEAWTDSLRDSSLFQNQHPVNKAYLLTAISSTVSFVPTLYGRGQECLAVAVAYPTTLSVSPTLLISDPHLLAFWSLARIKDRISFLSERISVAFYEKAGYARPISHQSGVGLLVGPLPN